ncbi:hypothetical protein EJ08DRAFT_221879 [Tothia fuscella]|uniref:Uncharacterized protein n=1 Tax=Tothia fuscella TaxID=1048955 RepID=A0A9P4P3P8_9PEZI|nr:hypothetical protein EJ08DRAFT_221879 [Tothia fuscella]
MPPLLPSIHYASPLNLHSNGDILPELLPRLSTLSGLVKRNFLTTPLRTLSKRQDSVVLNGPVPAPGYKKDSSLAPGAVAGITIGAVAGFLLIIILLYTLFNPNQVNSPLVAEEIVVTRPPPRQRSRSPRRSHRSHRSSREMREVRRSRSPRQQPQQQQRIIVEETTRVIPGAPPPPPPPPMSVVSERIVEERRHSRGPPPIRRVDGDDIVEVIEEGSSIADAPPRRERRRRNSGYRSVDPNQFGGGDYPQRPVRSRRYS